MSSQLQVTGEAKIRDIQGPVVANSGVITALDGAASQYVRGDGTLADFPTSSGGGSSVSYYLNSSVSQGTIGGVAYRELSKEPIIGAGTDIAISTTGYVASYITDINDPDVLSIPGGNFNCEFYFSVNNNTGSPTTYAELYKYDGTTFTLLGTSAGVPESINQGTTIAPYYFAIPVATAALSLTDRLAIRIYVNVDSRTVTLHTENGHLCQVVTTLSKGMVSLNNLTDQSQFLTTGTSGTNFAIVSSGDTHTFNLPVASATNTGKLSSTDWSTFNGKVPYTGATADVDLGVYGLTASLLRASENSGSSGSLILSTGTIGYNSGTNAITLVSSPTVANTLIIQSDVSSVVKIARIGLSSLTATRTYTLPDASGTIALTSNIPSITGLVPYTGATASVDLGVYALTAGDISASNLNAIGLGTQCGYLFLKQGTAFLSGALGYSSINASATKFLLTANVTASNNKEAIFELGSLTNNTQRTFTLPDLSGTLALLEGSQTFSGDKTFSGYALMDIGVTLAKTSGTPLYGGTNGYANLQLVNAGSVNSLYLIDGDTGKYSKLSFNNAADYTYTFPTASGTIALTSNLSSYVPYTGATGAVNLGFNLLTTNSINLDGNSVSGVLNIKSNSSITTSGAGYVSLVSGNVNQLSFVFNGGNSATFTSVSLSASRTYSLPDAGGTIALTSNLSAYLPLAGGTLTGNLTGTTASFNGSVDVVNGQINLSNSYYLTARNNANNTFLRLIGRNPSDKVVIDTDGYGTILGGALSGTSATFSGNVGVGIAANVTAGITELAIGSSNTNPLINGIRDGVNAFALSSDSAGTLLNERRSLDLRFSTNNTEKMRITSGGNVGIGNSNASNKLSVLANGSTSTGADSTAGFVIYGDTQGSWMSTRKTSATPSEAQFGSDSTGTFLTSLTDHPIVFRPNNTERMRITSAGAMYMTRISTDLTFADSVGGMYVKQNGSVSGLKEELRIFGNTIAFYSHTGSRYVSITEGGNVLIGTTSDDARLTVQPSGSGYGQVINHTNAGSQFFISFRYNGSTIGTITGNNSNVAYNTSSDYRLKQDLKDFKGLDLVSAIKTYDYQWKIDESRMYGVIAHELAEVLPYAVQGEKDGKEMQGVDYSKLTPINTKAIQELYQLALEQQAQIEELKALINK